MHGFVENINVDHASGWVGGVGVNSGESYIRVCFYFKGELIGEGIADTCRRDIENSSFTAYSYIVKFAPQISSKAFLLEVEAIAECLGETCRLQLWRPLKVGLEMLALTQSELKVFSNIAEDILVPVFDAKREVLSQITKIPKNSRKSLAVVAYANDSAAWFDYFYNYYTDVALVDAIYIITPSPDAFRGYQLAGLISVDGLPYEDTAKSWILSSSASGLLAFFNKIVVCDIDEIVIPPIAKLSLRQYVESIDEKVIIARGFDIVEVPGDRPFDLQLGVLEQRRFGIPNTALCKPHLISVPVRFSGGHHYCQYKLNFQPVASGLISLHLKWACMEMRKQVSGVVRKTSYFANDTELYAGSIGDENNSYPGIPLAKRGIFNIKSDAMRRFESDYYNSLRYDRARGLWVGKHVAADFMIDLGTYGDL